MLIELFVESGALLEGHFLLSSGRHADRYVQCAKLLQYPDKAAKVVEEMVRKIKEANLDVDMIVGPAMGGIVVAYELGRQLGVPAIFTERDDENFMTLRRGFEIEEGANIIVCEDVVTTGKSAKEAIEVVKAHGGNVLGVASLIDRSNGNFEYPLYSAIKLDVDTFDADECPMCKAGSEAVKLGSRKVFR